MSSSYRAPPSAFFVFIFLRFCLTVVRVVCSSADTVFFFGITYNLNPRRLEICTVDGHDL